MSDWQRSSGGHGIDRFNTDEDPFMWEGLDLTPEQRASAREFGAEEQHTRAGAEAADADWITLLALLDELLTAHPEARIVEVMAELDVDDGQARALLDDYAKGMREGWGWLGL